MPAHCVHVVGWAGLLSAAPVTCCFSWEEGHGACWLAMWLPGPASLGTLRPSTPNWASKGRNKRGECQYSLHLNLLPPNPVHWESAQLASQSRPMSTIPVSQHRISAWNEAMFTSMIHMCCDLFSLGILCERFLWAVSRDMLVVYPSLGVGESVIWFWVHFSVLLPLALPDSSQGLLGTTLPGFRSCNPPWLRLSQKT